MAVKIQIRRDSAINWTTTNPVLAQGELGLELDTGFMKAGNGTDNWNVLPYLFELTGDLIPLADNTMDIGSETKGYKNGYFKDKVFTEKVLSGDILLTDSFYNTSRTITIPPPDTGGETIGGVACHTYIQNVIDSLPKYIPEGTTVLLKFSNGTYKFSATDTIIGRGFYGGGLLQIEGETYTMTANLNQSTVFEDLATSGTNICWRFFNCDIEIDIIGIRFNSNATADRPFFWGFISCKEIRLIYVSYKNMVGQQRGVLFFTDRFTNAFFTTSIVSKAGACCQGNTHSKIHVINISEEESTNKPDFIVILSNSVAHISTAKPDVVVSDFSMSGGSLGTIGTRIVSADSV